MPYYPIRACEMYPRGETPVIGDEAAPQRGEHVAKIGMVTAVDGNRLRVTPYPGASWTEFWVDVDEGSVAVWRPFSREGDNSGV